MNVASVRPYADPDAAVCKIMEIAAGLEPGRPDSDREDQRAFLYELKATSARDREGLAHDA